MDPGSPLLYSSHPSSPGPTPPGLRRSIPAPGPARHGCVPLKSLALYTHASWPPHGFLTNSDPCSRFSSFCPCFQGTSTWGRKPFPILLLSITQMLPGPVGALPPPSGSPLSYGRRDLWIQESSQPCFLDKQVLRMATGQYPE